jgi:hypothetical protein
VAQAKVKTKLEFEAKITLELSETEAKALNEMTKYGIDPFIKGYKKFLGSYYIQPHEAGLKSLFETIDDHLPIELSKLEKYKKAICDADLEFKSS